MKILMLVWPYLISLSEMPFILWLWLCWLAGCLFVGLVLRLMHLQYLKDKTKVLQYIVRYHQS